MLCSSLSIIRPYFKSKPLDSDSIFNRSIRTQDMAGRDEGHGEKASGECLFMLTGIVVGGGVAGLSVPAALAASLGIAFAKRASGELFVGFYKEAQGQSSFTFDVIKKRFEMYIAEKRENLDRFEELYPIGKLFREEEL